MTPKCEAALNMFLMRANEVTVKQLISENGKCVLATNHTEQSDSSQGSN